MNIIKSLKNLYTSSVDIQKFIGLISSSKLYYQILNKIIQKIIKHQKTGSYNLLIETTSYCNAKCLMCPHSIMKRKQKIILAKTFQKIIDRIKNEKLLINKVYLSGFGEPLTDPQFTKRIKLLKKLNLFISFYTNASLLTAEISQKLIDLKVNEINISFNAVSKESYEKIMQLDYEKTKNNILHLIKLKKNNPIPFIRISSVISNQNENEISSHVKYWEKIADHVSLTQAHEWGGVIKNTSEHKFLKKQITYPCRSLWNTLAIDVDGNFVLCCRDFESNIKLGNIKFDSYSRITNSVVLKSFQKKHLKYKKDGLPPICQNCNFPYQHGLEWVLPKTFS